MEYQRQQNAASFAQSESANRQGLAQNYNAAATNYNNQLNSYAGQVGNLGALISGLSIKDDEKFGDLTSQIANLSSTLAQANFNESRPDFMSTVQSPYGAVQVDAPSLINVNEGLRGSLGDQLREYQSKLAGLQQQRKAEEERINSFASSLLTKAGDAQSRLGGVTIADKNQLDDLRRVLDGIENERRGFSSSILDEYTPAGFGTVTSNVSTARSQLNDLFSQRAAEEQRINDYRSGLESQFDALSGEFGGVTIADLAKINDLQTRIDSQQLGASRFSSKLGFDFNAPLSRLQELEDKLGGIRNQRTQEEARIKAAQEQALYTAQDIQSQLGSANTYDRTLLDSLTNTMNTARNRIGTFSSALPFSFDDATGRFTQIDQSIQSLLQQRQSKLDELTGKAGALSTGVGEIALQNEDQLKKKLAEAQQLQQLFGSYSGNDLQDERDSISGAYNAANNRLQELFDKRSSLETDAQGLLGRVSNQSFYDLANLNDPRAELTALQEQVGLYKANSAQDELAGILARLDGEKSRLEKDAANVAARNSTQTNQVNQYLMNGQIPSTMTSDQYLQLLALLGQRDAQGGQNNYYANTPSSFSRNLGVIRV